MTFENLLPEDDDERRVFTEYLLAEMLLARNPVVRLAEAEYENVLKSLDHLDGVMVIEEAYDAIMINYRVYEAGQINAALAHALDTAHDIDALTDVRRLSAVHLDNLLSSARAFLDITPSRLKALGGRKLQTAFSKLTNVQYDASPAYQFMEAMRNYTQHKGSSITTVSFDAEREDWQTATADSECKLVYTVRSGVHSDILKKGFKAKNYDLIAELADRKGRINITPLVRGYIVGLNAIMIETRAMLAEKLVEWQAVNDGCREALKNAGATGHMNAAIKRVGGHVVEEAYFHSRYPERLELLRKRNGEIKHLTRVKIAG